MSPGRVTTRFTHQTLGVETRRTGLSRPEKTRSILDLRAEVAPADGHIPLSAPGVSVTIVPGSNWSAKTSAAVLAALIAQRRAERLRRAGHISAAALLDLPAPCRGGCRATAR
jgi:hypothetical protein